MAGKAKCALRGCAVASSRLAPIQSTPLLCRGLAGSGAALQSFALIRIRLAAFYLDVSCCSIESIKPRSHRRPVDTTIQSVKLQTHAHAATQP